MTRHTTVVRGGMFQVWGSTHLLTRQARAAARNGFPERTVKTSHNLICWGQMR
jgi:hypothetical protein